MFTHNTPQEKPRQTSARQALIITQVTDLLLQACGLTRVQHTNQFNQSQQDESHHRGRGRPQQIGWVHLWSSLLLCAARGMHSFADWRRLLGLQPVGPFAPVWLTRNGLVKRLLQADLAPLQEIWELVNTHLAQTSQKAVPATLAAFATDILCLDETRLDALGRYLKPLRTLSTQDPACFAGKLVGLFDLRSQRWSRLEWREDVHENCRVDMLDAPQKGSGQEVCCSLTWAISVFPSLIP